VLVAVVEGFTAQFFSCRLIDSVREEFSVLPITTEAAYSTHPFLFHQLTFGRNNAAPVQRREMCIGVQKLYNFLSTLE